MQKNTFTIYNGNAKTMNMKAVKAKNGDPLDLTDCDEIEIALPGKDGVFVFLLFSDDQVEIVDDPLLGKFAAVIDEENSALLNPGVLQNFNVTFTIGDDKITVPYLACLSVLQRAVAPVVVDP